jgi:hypothetical protein
MPSYTHFSSLDVTSGLYAGAKGSETLILNSAGSVVSGVKGSVAAVFTKNSTAQTIYAIMPVAGTVTAVYVADDTADNKTTDWSLTHGSAGSVMASLTYGTAASVAGAVRSMTLGTVAVTAGESILITRSTTTSTVGHCVTIVYTRTS